MGSRVALLLILATATISACLAQPHSVLKPGDRAPEFRLQASDGKEYTLAQFEGKQSVALVWFLRAGSGGSKTQLSGIQGRLDQISKHNVQVLGITTSTLDECTEFARELNLTFPLLSDPNRAAATAYGTLRNGTGPACERWVFLIDDRGVIENVEKGEAVADKADLLLQALGDRTATAQGSAPQAPAQPAPGAPQVVKVGPVTYTVWPAVPITPTVTSSVVTVGSDRYTVYSYDDHVSASYVVVIPEGLKTVRGLLVNGCYSGGDSRWDWPTCEYYRQFMHLHGFALVATTATAGSQGSAQDADATAQARHRRVFQGFEDSMRVVATASGHPELANAPYVGVGFSAGGGFAFSLMVFAPEKTIAVASYSSPYMFKRRIAEPPGAAVLNVPSICITGEQEGFNVPLPPDVDPSTGPGRIYEVFGPYRPKGAEYAWMERQGIGHSYAENRQDVLGMPLLDAAVRARYPEGGDVTKGPIKLIDIDPATGWIADNTTWKSGLTEICPAAEFEGDLGQSSWLQNEDLAFIYRAYSTYDKPLAITSPGNCWPTAPSLDPGSDVPIVVDASKFPNWEKLGFYDGAKRLGEVTEGPTRLTATNLTPGYHVFSVLGTDAAGTVRTSDPALVVVRNPQVSGTEPAAAPTDPGLPADREAAVPGATAPLPVLKPGAWFTVKFPEMPPTLFALSTKRTDPAQMTVFLPQNYDPQRKHPLLILLNGSDGGNASNPAIARTLSEERDFICVALPLFKVSLDPDAPDNAPPLIIVRGGDGPYSWSLYKTMLRRLDELVPNIDPAHRVLGGFSNGAHATAAVLDGSNGEVAQMFSAFMFVEGGGKLKHYELLEGKPYLMVSSNAKSLPRAQEIADMAKAAGAQTTLIFEDIGQHGFPTASYPAVREWLRGPALGAPGGRDGAE